MAALSTSTRSAGTNRLAIGLASSLAALALGCTAHLQNGLILPGDWSIGARSTPGEHCICGPLHLGPCHMVENGVAMACDTPPCDVPCDAQYGAGQESGAGQCGAGQCAAGQCRAARKCCLRRCGPPKIGPPDAVLQDGDQVAESYMPPVAGRGHCAQASVHTRFHPVPTRPVLGNPNPNTVPGQLAPVPPPTMEELPHEYNSTPRLRAAPRPKLDWDDLQEEKKKAKDAEAEEDRPLPIYNWW